jgi:hemoglobin
VKVPGLSATPRVASEAVVDSFVARCAGDDRIYRKFGRTDLPVLKKKLADQLCVATGGPCTYGRSMRDTHLNMKVTDTAPGPLRATRPLHLPQ